MSITLETLSLNDLSESERNRSTELRCVDNTSGLFISWTWRSDNKQIGYQINLARSGDYASLEYDTGHIYSEDVMRIQVPLDGLPSFSTIFIRVRLLSASGPSEWSSTHVETGWLGGSEWPMRWLEMPGRKPSKDDSRPIWFKSQLLVPLRSTRARAYCSAHGWYRLLVNGIPINGDSQVPRYTPFDHLIEYQVYDLTEKLRVGENLITAVVGDGRFRGSIGMRGARNTYGDRAAFTSFIRVEMDDITPIEIHTSDQWTVGYGPILASDPKLGETVDFNKFENEYEAWITSTKLSTGQPAAVKPHDKSVKFVCEGLPAVCQTSILPATKMWRSPKHSLLIDFGQNISGVAAITLPPGPGLTLSMVFSETLTPEGNLNRTYLEFFTPAVDNIILGNLPHVWRPWFTIRGFRYVEIVGPDEILSLLQPRDIEACVYTTDIDYCGSFRCSNEQLNQLHDNTRWSWRGNNLDTPMDCPTRERSGWTGDLQVFTPTAMLLTNASPVLRTYMRNLSVEQLADGRVPVYIPSESGHFSGGASFINEQLASSVGWGDASVIIPWQLYWRTGDKSILRSQYDSMKSWLRYIEDLASRYSSWTRRLTFQRIGKRERYIVDRGFHFGEWFRPGESSGFVMISNLLFASPVVPTAYFAFSTRLFSQIAAVLGRSEDAEKYETLSADIKSAFREAFVKDSGRRIGEDRQDDYVRTLAFGLLSSEEQSNAVERLSELIQNNGYHLDTGFLSTPLLLPVLVDNGKSDLAFRILLQDTAPSWLIQLSQGATTTWETWEGYDSKGNAHGSHNHYSYGSVTQFFYEQIAGIVPLEPGYKRIRICPLVEGGLTSAECSFQTPYGVVQNSWTVKGSSLFMNVTVPAGTEADVFFDGRFLRTFGPGSHLLETTIHNLDP